MAPTHPPVSPRMAAVAAVTVAVILYGSLYPFVFADRAAPDGALPTLLATWRQRTSRGDIIANVLLYVPFGLFAAMALTRRSGAARLAVVGAIGLALTVAVELVQIYIPSREPKMFDVYANAAGALIGAALAALPLGRIGAAVGAEIEWRRFPLLLLASWCGYRLFPFVPTIDLHKYWDAIKPLIFAPRLPVLDLYRHAATWLVVAALIEALVHRRPRLAFALFVPGVLALRVLILDAYLSPAEVVGAAAALPLWLMVMADRPWRWGALAALFAGVVVTQSLAPFAFLDSPRPFGWIPFLSFMQGSIEANIRSMFEKLFMYGSLLWLLHRAGLSLGAATALCAALVFALRYAQVYLPGRSAEITDAVLVLALALAMALLPDQARAAPARAP